MTEGEFTTLLAWWLIYAALCGLLFLAALVAGVVAMAQGWERRLRKSKQDEERACTSQKACPSTQVPRAQSTAGGVAPSLWLFSAALMLGAGVALTLAAAPVVALPAFLAATILALRAAHLRWRRGRS